MPAHTRSAPCAPAGSRPIEGCRFTGRLRVFSTAPEPSETNAEALPDLGRRSRDPVRDLERHGDDGEGRVVAGGRRENAPVAGEEIIEVVESTAGVDHGDRGI